MEFRPKPLPEKPRSRSSLEQRKLVRSLNAPAIVDPRKEKLELQCDYDLGGLELYSVIWYKNNEPLLKYAPSLEPKIVAFGRAGVNVSLEHSSASKLLLLGSQDLGKNIEAYEGRYLCEVTADGLFYGDFAEANVTVGILPRSRPVLDGLAGSYEVGEQLEASCTSGPSLPPAELSFYLNGRQVDSRYTQHERVQHTIGEALVASVASISMRLGREHFSGGSLTLECRATLPELQLRDDYRTEKRATLGSSSNQRLAQEPPVLSSSGATAVLGALAGLGLLLHLPSCA